MGFFDKFFGKKKEEKKDEEIQEVPVSEEPGIENVQVDKKKNIIRTKCPCGHKKAKKTSDGLIKCRSCKTTLGRAV